MKIKKPVRDCTFTVTCTPDEKKEVFQRAQKAGLTVSGYVRWVLNQTKETGKNDRD